MAAKIDHVDSGYVFIDGQAVASPLQISTDHKTGELLVNGHRINYQSEDSEDYSSLPAGSKSRFRILRRTQGEFVEEVESGAVIISFNDAPVCCIEEYSFFSCLLDSDSSELEMLLDEVQDDDLKDVIESWLVSFTPSDTLLDSAEQIVTRYQTADAANNAHMWATRMLSMFTYPMTMFGLLVGVYAFGHLMMTTPNTPTLHPHAEPLGLMTRATVISVSLICAHASLDLAWTLLTSQAGQMREINPFGANFIESPSGLIVFKAVATLGACGLLLGLRHHRIAQTACWWMCLVCTILTFRWLIFSSMLV